MFQITGSQEKLESDSIFFHDTRLTQEGQTGAQREECYAKCANRMREGIWGWLQVIQNFLFEVCFPLQIFKIHIYTGSDFSQWSRNRTARGSGKQSCADRQAVGCCITVLFRRAVRKLQLRSAKRRLVDMVLRWPLGPGQSRNENREVRQEGAGTCDTVCLLLVLSHLLVWQSGMFHFHSTTLKGNKIWDCGCVSAQG